MRITIDASVFAKRIGEFVTEGETLGIRNDKPVQAPFDGYIGGFYINAHEHTLSVHLISYSRLAGPTQSTSR